MRAGKPRGMSLLETLAVLFLVAIILAVVGGVLHQLTRLMRSPLDRDWDALTLSLEQVGRDYAGATGCTQPAPGATAARLDLEVTDFAPTRLPLPLPGGWTFPSGQKPLVYALRGRELWRSLGTGSELREGLVLGGVKTFTLVRPPGGALLRVTLGTELREMQGTFYRFSH